MITTNHVNVDETGDKTPQLPLTTMENKVLHLVFAGLSSQQAADLICVSKRTVDYHLYFAFRKLNVNGRIKAYRRAVEIGALRPLAPEDEKLLRQYKPEG